MTAPILVSRTRLWSRAAPWGFHCRSCHTAMTGYPSLASAADEGRGHWSRMHRCCELHDPTCGVQDWCCGACPELAEVRGYIDGAAL